MMLAAKNTRSNSNVCSLLRRRLKASLVRVNSTVWFNGPHSHTLHSSLTSMAKQKLSVSEPLEVDKTSTH